MEPQAQQPTPEQPTPTPTPAQPVTPQPLPPQPTTSAQTPPQPTVAPTDPAQPHKGYGKRPMWQWILMYVVVAIVLYGIVYLVFFHGGSSDATNSNSLY